MKVLGIDIGGTKVRMGVVDESMNIYLDKKIPTTFPLYNMLEKEVINILDEHPDVDAIGIGTHGFVDSKNGRVVYATDLLPGWTGTEVKAQLEEATGLRVEVDNDANCAALAEARIGAAKDYNRTLCLTLGTGLGGGAIIDEVLLSGGPHGGAAEFGHMILYPNGVTCTCGRRGCFEQYVSGTALRRRIKEASLPYEPEELFTVDDPKAKQLIREFTYDLAVIISSLQATFDMEVVVLSGGVAEASDYWMDDLLDQLKPMLLNDIDVKIAEFKNDAGMFGAAQLVL
ncbi:ROK family protein [Tenuibacillus multivorans]|uniref:Glucokinase n=1 Tax=Tenuibacillus multivorans TaxID=237069 RepID=A0A1G9WCV2_9BACI|nr:ROK family protein [Tenuibacillus multivorans]GEL76394.1 glucokinase [Tenuibacillus multivorans]SDM82016.1 glucokinase [Tenuibacillus multivorans]